MKRDPKPAPVEAVDETRFYVIFSELAKADEELNLSNTPSADELEEIEQVMRMVGDVNDGSPRFMTST